ncbi:hypothetical protein JCM15765_14580 [Paradesulfitobacterium aromaticivorans]
MLNVDDAIQISPKFNDPFANMDNLYWRLSRLKYGEKLTLDLRNHKFLRPIAVIGLLLAAKQAFTLTGERVRIINLTGEIFPYFERIDFFENEFIYTTESLSFWNPWGRSSNSLSVLGIVKIENPSDVFNLKERVEKILEAWFTGKILQPYRDSAVKAIVEICNNSIEHSRLGYYEIEYGECYCMLQKYTQNNHPAISVAIGDLGVGIRAHLKSKYNWNRNDVFYIQKALDGLSGRKAGAGGLGLRRTQEIIQQFGGNLAVKSGKGIVVFDRVYESCELNHSLKGTQCIINLRPTART